MTGVEKVAVLIKSLAPDLAEPIVARLGGEDGERVRRQIESLKDSPPATEEVSNILAEFEDLLKVLENEFVMQELLNGDQDTDRTEGANDEKEQQPKATTYNLNADDPVEELMKVNKEVLATALAGEPPHLIAMLLSRFPGSDGGAVFKHLPGDMRRELAGHLTDAVDLPSDLENEIARAILAKCGTEPSPVTESDGDRRSRKIAEMLRSLENTERGELLAILEEKDPETATAVKDQLYLFEDLLRLDDRSLQKVLGELETKTLAESLSDVSDEIREKVLGNLSQRAGAMLREELDLMGVIPKPQRQEAQKTVVQIIQRLDQNNELVMVDQS